MRKIVLLLALGATTLATPAVARNGAWYVGGDFGGMIVNDVKFDYPVPSSSAGADQALILNHDYGYDGALFVGYDLGAFRLEAEVSYKNAHVKDIDTNFRLPGDGPTFPDHRAGGGTTSALSFMINGMLDFGDENGISVFAGGGVGVAKIDYNNVRAFSNQAAIVDESDTRFAWQLMAGVRQAVSDNIDITVRYRFFNAGSIRTVDYRGIEADSKFRSHSLLGGITFNFGAPPPPPPPGPPPPPPPPPEAPPPPPPPAPPPPPPVAPAGPFIVFFDWNQSNVTPQAAGILDNAAAAYQQTGQAQVVVAGHADRSGPADYNVGLSQRRANNVKAYLAGHGIPDGAMVTRAFGESRPLVETPDGVREPQNRRVEVTMGPGAGQ